MTHAGEKRETIAEKLGINMDTITEWKKMFVKHGMEVYLGLKKKVTSAKKSAMNVKKKVGEKITKLETKIAPEVGKTPLVTSKANTPSISKIEQYIVEVLQNSYASVAHAIQTYSESHGKETKKKILKTYKKELKRAKKLIKAWTKKVNELKMDMKEKKGEKGEKETKGKKEEKGENKKHKGDQKDKGGKGNNKKHKKGKKDKSK